MIELRLEPDQRAILEDHVRLLVAWNNAINLTAIRDLAEIARLHVLDSLTAVPVLRARGVARYVDLGSGAGFPGLPLAAALPAEALLVDSVGKKTAFLDAVVAATGVRGVRVATVRAESLAFDPAQRGSWPAVTARAVASLGDLVELAFPLLAVGGILAAWKRGALDEELRSGAAAAQGLGGGEISVEGARTHVLPGHVIVVVRKTAPTPAAWPRDPALRRRRPW